MTQISVELLDHMGSDLSIVNAARVSFDKASELEWRYDPATECSWKHLKESDAKLLRYLATHGHWSPFSHAFASFRIKAPMFVARQLGKHQVGLAWNEVSRRYVDSEPEFYTPDVWRARAADVKQGSSECPVVMTNLYHYENAITPEGLYEETEALYRRMLEIGVCPEQARMVLPQSTMTTWIWSGSLYAFARVCGLRLAKDTQKETQVVAKYIAEALEPRFPVSWKELSK